MGPDILVPLGTFVMVVCIVLIAMNSGTQRRRAALQTVEEAIRSGQQVTPEFVRALGMPRENGNGDLKAGAILIAVAVPFMILGAAITNVSSDADEAMPIMSAIAAFPGLIGVVLVGFGLLGRKKNSDEA